MVGDRRKFRRIWLPFDSKKAELTVSQQRIRELEAQVERLTSKKRRAVPNPNEKFMQIEEILSKKPRAEDARNREIEVQEQVGDEIDVVLDKEIEDNDEVDDDIPAEIRTRSGRQSNYVY
jgi:hypothetical protein